MVNVNKLKGKLVELGWSVADLAREMEIDKATLYRKLRDNGKTMLVCEANEIIRILHLTKDEAVAIFFAENVA